MRNIFLSIALVISCSFSYAQSTQQPMTEQEVLTILCHKWEYKEFLADGKKMPYPRKWIDASLQFKSDGTVIKKEEDEDIIGKWSYNHKKLLITIEFKKEKERWRIQELSETTFMFREYNGPSGFSTVMLRVE